MEQEQNCQVCGSPTTSLQMVTIANGGLIDHKQCCSRCYYVVQIEEMKKQKNENLILG
jgi:hypothetical protein